MIRIRVEQIWDGIGQVGTTIFDVTAVLIGSGILALLVTLCLIWSSAWLLEKVASKFLARRSTSAGAVSGHGGSPRREAKGGQRRQHAADHHHAQYKHISEHGFS
jgi:hypothetical protein